MLTEIISSFATINSFIKIQHPATENQIADLVDKLGEIPSQLLEFLKEMNGDGFLMMSISQIIETNFLLREINSFMPLDCLLFFATNGCGDYFGFQITKEGISHDNIFKWDHEYDNRIWVSGSIKDLIIKFYTNECL